MNFLYFVEVSYGAVSVSACKRLNKLGTNITCLYSLLVTCKPKYIMMQYITIAKHFCQSSNYFTR